MAEPRWRRIPGAPRRGARRPHSRPSRCPRRSPLPARAAGAPEELVRDPRDLALETIVRRERPVLFVRDGEFDTTEVTTLGPEAVDLVGRMKQQGSRLLPLLPLIGRIDVMNFPGDFVGTGWFVDTDIVVTNRHVASLIARWDGRKFAFIRGIGAQLIESSFCNAHEFDDLAPDAARVFKVTEVLYIEPDKQNFVDVLGIVDEPLAFLDPSKTRPPKAALDEIMESFR